MSPTKSFCPFLATPYDVVSRMLALADVNEDDVLYDLGSGDGRILVAAAQGYGARAVGFDINPKWVLEAQQKAREAGVEHLVEVFEQDAREVDCSAATVLTMYLVASAIEQLEPKMRRFLSRDARVVSLNCPVKGWRHEQRVIFEDDSGRERALYLYRIGTATEPI